MIYFLAVLIIAPRIAIIGGNSEAGLHATQTPFLLDCRIPANSSRDFINVNLTQKESERVEIEGRCFLLCATHVKYINEVKKRSTLSMQFCIPLQNLSKL